MSCAFQGNVTLSASGFWWKALDTEGPDQAVLCRKGLLAWPIAICSLVFKGHPDLRKALHSVPESLLWHREKVVLM